MFVTNDGLLAETEGQSQSDDLSATKRLSGEKNDGTLFKGHVCQVGLFSGVTCIITNKQSKLNGPFC